MRCCHMVLLLPRSGNGLLVAANAADSMGGDQAAAAVLREMAPSLAPPKDAP